MLAGTQRLKLIDSCITQLKAQGPARNCNESKEEEESSVHGARRTTVETSGSAHGDVRVEFRVTQRGV